MRRIAVRRGERVKRAPSTRRHVPRDPSRWVESTRGPWTRLSRLLVRPYSY